MPAEGCAIGSEFEFEDCKPSIEKIRRELRRECNILLGTIHTKSYECSAYVSSESGFEDSTSRTYREYVDGTCELSSSCCKRDYISTYSEN